jgi:3-hydroxyisobutyrate dehydrogenase-like beta-hydroxyacid dehydrogenase
MVMKVGFIGVGSMGGPMSRNIVKTTNHDVKVFDLNADAVAACVAVGATRGGSVAEIAETCEVVMLSLPTPAHVEAVVAGPGGIAAHAKAGTTVIDLSTNAPAMIKQLAAMLSAKGVALIEAPVTGGVVKAVDGTLTIMVGGDEAVIEKQRPLLSSISALVVHMGPHGSASVTKLVNNMMGLCSAAIAAEGLMIGKMAGVDLTKLVEVISNGSGNSNGFRNMVNRALKGSFGASFALDLAYKDLGLAVDLEKEHGVPGLVAPQVLNLMRMARGLGLGQDDSTSVIKVYEKVLGQEARL